MAYVSQRTRQLVPPDVSQGIARLRLLHGIGRESLKSCPGDLPADAEFVRGDEVFSSTKLRKIRLLAKAVTSDELNELLAVFSAPGQVLGETAFLMLGGLKTHRSRMQLCRSAIRLSLSARDLQRACQPKRAKQAAEGVGRRPVIDRDVGKRLEHLERHCRSFARFGATLREANENDLASAALPEAVMSRLDTAMDSVSHLLRAVEACVGARVKA